MLLPTPFPTVRLPEGLSSRNTGRKLASYLFVTSVIAGVVGQIPWFAWIGVHVLRPDGAPTQRFQPTGPVLRARSVG